MIIFSALFIAFFGLLVARTNITSKYGHETLRAQQSLSASARAATFKAAQDLQYDKELSNVFYLFKEESSRQAAVDEFFTVLGRNAGMDSQTDARLMDDHGRAKSGDLKLLKDHVPAICMFDSDGFYLWYNAVVQEPSSGRRHLNETMTSINTWSITAGWYAIRYYAGPGDIVEVTLMDVEDTASPEGIYIGGGTVSLNALLIAPNGTSIKGNFKDVYNYFLQMENALGKELKSGEYLDFHLGLDELDPYFCKTPGTPDKETFEKKRNYVVITKTETLLQNYLNDYNHLMNGMVFDDENSEYIPGMAGSRGKVYEFTLPQIKDDAWAQLIDNPGVMAFFQGDLLTNGTESLNIYSLYGYKMQANNGYFAKDGIYHRGIEDSRCPDAGGKGRKEKDGKWYPTKIDAAKAGNYPCPNCNP